MSKLKHQGIVKVFFSSPFGGMEEEREELTRRYFPQIRHLCSAHGLHFAAVDMRWGITSESSENAQVINICLRELDRSDMFIGFFGQRYGWHGADDNILQDNFNNALGRYPWLEQYRDKSVTELEFLHGFLNDPGRLPAAIFFRDKGYDDRLREEGKQKGDKKQVFKYSAESEHSIELMADLKSRVLGQKEKSLGVYMDYKKPDEAAKIMFETIMKYLKETLLADMGVAKRTKREDVLSQHDAFLTSRCSIFVNKDKYLKALNGQPMNKTCDTILVTGEPGSGKSAALCNWIASLKDQKSSYAVVYHFVGFAKDSTGVNQILTRLVDEFEYVLYQDIKPQLEGTETPEAGSMEETKYLVHKLLSVVQKVLDLGKTPVIVIDGLDKVTGASKIAKVLYWLPSELPAGCTVVVSTLTSDTTNIEELKARNYRLVDIEPLQEDAKRKMAVQILKESGKEMSPHQLDKIVSAEMTKLPIFLRVTLSELVSFGYFRLLDKKIADLISSPSTEELFGKVLMRLEEDYNVQEYSGNIVEQVMCSIYLSRQGVTELEIKEIFSIPDHIWSPLYFAIEKLTINQSDCIQFGFNELKHACSVKYLTDPKKKSIYLRHLIDHFDKVINKMDNYGEAEEMCPRPVLELPWLWVELGDMEGLADCLSNFYVFTNLQRHASYDLVTLWRQTGYTGHAITDKLLLTFDKAISVMYTKADEQGILDTSLVPGLKIDWFLRMINEYLSTAGFHDCREKVILRDINLLTDLMELPKCQQHKINIQKSLISQRYQLACLYSQTDKKAEKGIQLHMELLDDYLRQGKTNGMSEKLYKDMSSAYHGITVAYNTLLNFEKMIEFSEKAMDCYKQMTNPLLHDSASSWNSLGVGHMGCGNLEKAVECFDKSIKDYEEENFGETPPVIGEIINNKALCYRRLGRLEEAEEIYQKSLEVKQKAFGTEHQIVAMSYMNLGSLELYRKNFEKSKEHSQKAREIFEALDLTWTNPLYIQCWENELVAIVSMERYVEVDQHIMKILQWRLDDGSMDRSLPSLYREMLVYYVREKVHYERAFTMAKVLLTSVLKHDLPVYVFLDMALQNLPKEFAADVPEEMTLKYVIDRNPGRVDILGYYIQTYVVPACDLDELVDRINRLHDANEDLKEQAYNLALNWCSSDNATHLQCRQRILEEGLKRYPDNLEICLNQSKCFRHQDRADLALPYAMKVADQQMSNYALVSYTAETAALANDFVTSKHYARHVITTCDDEALKAKAQHLMDLIEVAEKSEVGKTDTDQDGGNQEASTAVEEDENKPDDT